MILELLPKDEKKAMDIIMKSTITRGDDNDFIYLVLDNNKNRIEVTNGRVMLDITPGSNEPINKFTLLQRLDGETVSTMENIHIPYKYILILKGLSYVKVHMEASEVTGEPIPKMLELCSSDTKTTIWINDFKFGENNTAYLKKPSTQKNLFGQDQVVHFSQEGHKEKFDKTLKELNKTANYTIQEDITYAMGSTKNSFQFYLVTKTPLSH